VMLAELSPLLDGPVDGIVLPGLADGYAPGSDAQRVAGILLGPLPRGRAIRRPGIGSDGHRVDQASSTPIG